MISLISSISQFIYHADSNFEWRINMNKNTPILVGLAVSFLTFSNVAKASHIEHECHKGTIQYIINTFITTNDCDN